MKIENAVVLVTGANRGLGRALVDATLAAGARRVYATARRPERLDELVKSAPGKIVPLALDVTDAASIREAAELAEDVNLLVNNAGLFGAFDLLSTPADALAKDFATNFFGLVEVTKAFVPALERAAKAGPSAVVNVLSIVSLASAPGIGGYSASKAAALSVTQAFRGTLAKKGVAVHGVLAGAIDTDMVRGVEMPKAKPEDVAKAIVAGIEQGLEDIAPDPISRDLVATWWRDPKAVERQLATMG